MNQAILFTKLQFPIQVAGVGERGKTVSSSDFTFVWKE